MTPRRPWRGAGAGSTLLLAAVHAAVLTPPAPAQEPPPQVRDGSVAPQPAAPAPGQTAPATPSGPSSSPPAQSPPPAQEAPRASVTLTPAGPVTVGTPLTVTATILVPTWMPEPPGWPDLQIADAITRLPDRATRPASRRVGRETWSGVIRSWEVIPQRAARYDLGTPAVAVTYADPAGGAPVTVSVPLPAVRFTAALPPGAEGMDPFLPATSLTLSATTSPLPDAPKPGDAFTLTLTATAAGPPAMLLPPLTLPAPPPGLRAYPSQPTLSNGPPATRTEATTYVIEAPGRFTLPPVTLAWWNTATSTRETASTAPLTITAPAAATPARAPWLLLLLLLLPLAALPFLRRPHAPSERSLYRALRRSIRSEPAAPIHRRLAAWQAAAATPRTGAITAALRSLDRTIYGPAAASDAEARDQLAAAVAAARAQPAPRPRPDPLAPLNP